MFADCGDFNGGNGLGTRRELMRACGDFSSGVIRALPHTGEEFVEAEIRDFVFFGAWQYLICSAREPSWLRWALLRLAVSDFLKSRKR